MREIALAVHGGAGSIEWQTMPPEAEASYRAGLERALRTGWGILGAGGSALQAVEHAVVTLEDDPQFNAGRGSVFTSDGGHELDAAIMCGATLRAGSIANLRHIRNPIRLASAVMEHSPHLMLVGAGAEEFACEKGFELVPAEYFYTQHRYEQLLQAREHQRIQLDHSPDRGMGTVGAVALDSSGDLAAATSTGGMTNKRPGRVGDAPIIGAGTYADNASCAVSCTGTGEYFMRAVAAHDIACLMSYRGLGLIDACNIVLNEKIAHLGGQGGVIAIDRSGTIAMPFNTKGMFRGSIRSGGEVFVGIG